MWVDEDDSGEANQGSGATAAAEISTLYNVKPKELTEMSTLSNVCLNSICKNIDRFNTAFHGCKDKKMKKSFFLFRRFYSNQIIKMLINQRIDKTLDKKYFDLLINEYLKELDFHNFGETDLDIILEMLPEIGNTLEKVLFNFNPKVYRFPNHGMYLKQFVKNALQHLPLVKVMLLKHGDGKTLEMISYSCKELKEITLNRKGNTSNIIPLELKFIREYDEGVSYLLKNLPNLERIVYENLPNVLHKLHVNDLRNNSLHTVPKYNLTSLYINAYINFQRNMDAFEETLVIASELCPRISEISVIGIKTEKQLHILYRFLNLIDVIIRGEDASLDVSDFLQHSGKKMRRLEVQCFKLSLSTLVENCRNLDALRLGDIDYHSNEEKSVTILRNMRTLCLIAINKINEQTEMAIQQLFDSCPNLDDLHFISSNCNEHQVSAIIQKYCKKSQTLKQLAFTECAVEEAFLQQIVFTCTPLKKLVINFCKDMNEIKNLLDTIKSIKRGVVVEFVPQVIFISDGHDYLDAEGGEDMD